MLTHDPAKNRYDKYLALNPDLQLFARTVKIGAYAFIIVWGGLLGFILWLFSSLFN